MFRIVVKAKALDVGPILQFMAERNIPVEECGLIKDRPPKAPKELTSESNVVQRKPSKRNKGKSLAEAITNYVQGRPEGTELDLAAVRGLGDLRGHSKNAAYQALPGLVKAGVLNKISNGRYMVPYRTAIKSLSDEHMTGVLLKPSLKPEFQP